MPKIKNETPTFAAMIERLKKDAPHLIRRADSPSRIRKIQTGVFQVDRILGGGLPVNRISEIYGHKGSFKTTLAVKTMGNFLMRCGCCLAPLGQCPSKKNIKVEGAVIESEHAFDEDLPKKMGLPTDRIHILSSYSGEQAVDYAKEVSRLPEVGVVIVDSLADLFPVSELEDSAFDGQSRGARASLIGKLMRSLVTLIDTPAPKLVITINHLMHSVGKIQFDYAPGGVEQFYHASVVLKVWATGLGDNKVTYEAFDGAGIRKKEIGFLVQHSKISHDNVSGEYKLFIESDPARGVTYGQSDDTEVVFKTFQALGEFEAAPFVCNKEKFTSQKAVMRYWRDNPAVYYQVKEDLINDLKARTGR